jgi:hypothetical protein
MKISSQDQGRKIDYYLPLLFAAMSPNGSVRRRLKRLSILGLIGSTCFGLEPELSTTYTHSILDRTDDRPVKPYIKIIGDINRDGKEDILVASAKGGGVVWYESPNWRRHIIEGKGSFSEAGKLSDVDRDGDLDAVLPSQEGVFWYENSLNKGAAINNSQSLWEKHFIGSDGANVHDLSVGDLDNDGDVEVIARYEKELRRPLTVWWQESLDQWTEMEVFNHYGEGLGIGDVDGDGLKDLVINEIWLKNSKLASPWRPVRFTSGMPDQLKVVCADINADGRDEIVVAPQSRVPEGTVGKIACYFLKSIGPSPLWEEVVLEEGAEEVNKVHGIAIGDMDLDGDLDITTSKRHDAIGSVEIAVFYNRGGHGLNWRKALIARSGSHNHLAGDLDGDGDLDIVGANWNDDAVVEIWISQ